jgi:hypothetical protein
MNLVEFPAEVDAANGITCSEWTELHEMICVDLLNFARLRCTTALRRLHDLRHGDHPVTLGRLKS